MAVDTLVYLALVTSAGAVAYGVSGNALVAAAIAGVLVMAYAPLVLSGRISESERRGGRTDV